jgi:hypothetical protein
LKYPEAKSDIDFWWVNAHSGMDERSRSVIDLPGFSIPITLEVNQAGAKRESTLSYGAVTA